MARGGECVATQVSFQQLANDDRRQITLRLAGPEPDHVRPLDLS
jgi:hypothetical protein